MYSQKKLFRHQYDTSGRLPRLFTLLAFLGFLSLWAHGARYRLVEIDTDLDGQSVPTGLNDHGTAVGLVIQPDGKRSLFIRYADGAVQAFGNELLVGTPWSVNNWDQVVGSSWNLGHWIQRGNAALPLEIQSRLPVFINDSQVVAGTYIHQDVQHGYLADLSGQKGKFADIGDLGGGDTVIYGLNNAGLAVGSSVNSAQFERAFVYDETEGMRAIEVPMSRGGFSRSVAVSDLGQVLVQTSNASFLVEGNLVQEIVAPQPASLTRGISLNDRAKVVGVYVVQGDVFVRPFLWDRGTCLDLRHLVATPDKVTLRSPVAINEAGVILVSGLKHGKMAGFLLIPIASET